MWPRFIIAIFITLAVGCASTAAPIHVNYDIGPTETSATMQFEQAIAGRDNSNGNVALCLMPTDQPPGLPTGVAAVGCVRMTHDEIAARVKNCYLFLSSETPGGIQCQPE